MSAIDIQFMQGESEEMRLKKLRQLVEEIVLLSRRNGTSTSSSGGTSTAQYILAGANAALANAFVLRASGGVNLNLSGGFATLTLGTVPYSSLESIPNGTLLGRYDPTAGTPQVVAVGTGLTLSPTGSLSADASGYPAQLGFARI